MKAQMMNHMEAFMTDVMDIEIIALNAFSTVTQEDRQGWILKQ